MAVAVVSDRVIYRSLTYPLAYQAGRPTFEISESERPSCVERGFIPPVSLLTPKRILSDESDFATSRRDARQLLIGQDCIA